MGWVAAATLVNLAVMLRYLNIDVSSALGAGLIILAAAAGVALRMLLRNFFAPLAVAWALTAIAIKQSGQTSIVVTCAAGVIACLIAALSFVVDLNNKQHE
jgi:hypothetical protein